MSEARITIEGRTAIVTITPDDSAEATLLRSFCMDVDAHGDAVCAELVRLGHRNTAAILRKHIQHSHQARDFARQLGESVGRIL